MENNKKEEKYYVRSNGEQVAISTMNTEHILNALGKKQRDIFNCQNKDEASKMLKEINDVLSGCPEGNSTEKEARGEGGDVSDKMENHL